MTPQEIETRIEEFFDHNYELLRLEGGQNMTEDVRQAALQQVLYYYRKMRSVAEKVTETEVKLTLPDQTTAQSRSFTIEGIVDIVREDDEVWMYDIKTHDPDYIAANKAAYESQLNVYAHIFENLRGNQLDHTAVISTAFPTPMRNAIASGDPQKIEREMAQWNPLIELPYQQEKVQQTIQDFAETVDKIETNCFEPTPVDVLKAKMEGSNKLFATRVCRNCDARFSCQSYREYASQSGARAKSNFKKYFEDFGDDLQQEEFVTANIDLDKMNQPIDIER